MPLQTALQMHQLQLHLVAAFQPALKFHHTVMSCLSCQHLILKVYTSPPNVDFFFFKYHSLLFTGEGEETSLTKTKSPNVQSPIWPSSYYTEKTLLWVTGCIHFVLSLMFSFCFGDRNSGKAIKSKYYGRIIHQDLALISLYMRIHLEFDICYPF